MSSSQAPDVVASRKELAKRLHSLLSRLTYRQRTILTLYFGLCGSYEYTTADIARIMGGMGELTVRRLLGLALRKLQHPSTRADLSDYL